MNQSWVWWWVQEGVPGWAQALSIPVDILVLLLQLVASEQIRPRSAL